MDKINSTLSIEQRELLDLHLRYVIEENKTTNLTRITDWETAKILHVEDSLVGVPFIEKAPQGDYLDMGTGAGFPGIPIAITGIHNVFMLISALLFPTHAPGTIQVSES